MSRKGEIVMTSKAIRCSWLATWVIGLALITTPSLGLADVCQGVPDCQGQTQAPISYTGWETQGWAYYCVGDHPYFVGYICGLDFYEWDNSCLTAAENAFADDQSKLDVTITNWCWSTQSITLTLACSARPVSPSSCP
jgi:hypothetical protein